MGGFRRFIETSGKTVEEIRKAIAEMLDLAVEAAANNVVFEVTELISSSSRVRLKKESEEKAKRIEEKEYAAEKIPQLSERRERGGASAVNETPYEERFAYPHEAVNEDVTERELAILNRIKQMRELELRARGNGIVKRAAELTMVEQGSFMADAEDDYDRRAYCALPTPVYAAMSNSQLRTFFTWRTDARRGKYTETDKPYVLLYCYELLNKIGAESSVDAFEKLLEVRDGCRSFAPYLKTLMPRWLKDFYAFNDVREKYPDINAVLKTSAKKGYEREFSEIDEGNYAGKLEFLAENSSYNIKDSIFFSEQTRPLLESACECALTALDGYFKARGTELSELLCGKLKKDHSWSPFRNAIVNLDTADGFRPVRISASERYCVKRGEPALELFDFAPMRGFIGYVLKSVEAELRVRTGFSRKLSPKLTMLQNDVKNRTRLMDAVFAPEFERVIPRAVDEYCLKHGVRPSRKSSARSEDETQDYAAAKVEIDVSKLSEIRSKADETAKKLIVSEQYETPPVNGTAEYHESFSAAEKAAEQIRDDEFSARIDEYKEELSPLDGQRRVQGAAFESLSEEWREFAGSLTEVQLDVLEALVNGNVRAFCRERGLLPETVFEEINTESLSAFGDVVIEHGEIVPDYSGEVSEMLDQRPAPFGDDTEPWE